MRLRKIELHNWGPLQSFRHKFQPGLTGVFGANGSGKTTLVRAIETCFTSDFGDVPKARKIYRHTQAGDTSYAKLSAEHDGVLFTITRGLSPSMQLLELPDEEIKPAVEIASRLETLLEMPLKSFAELTFVRQGRIADFLHGDFEERSRSLARLCGAEGLERLWKLLGEQISLDQALGGKVVDNSAQLKERRAELDKRLSNLQQQLSEANKQILSESEAQKIASLLQNQRRLELEQQEQQELSALCEQLQPQVAAALTKLQTTEKEAMSIKQSVEDYAAAELSWKATLQAIETDAREREWRSSLQERVTAPAPQQTMQDPGYDIEKLQIRLADLLREEKETQRFCQTFLAAGVAACPVCGTPSSQLQPQVEASQQRLLLLADRIRKTRKAIARQAAYESSVEKFERNLEKHQQQVEVCRETLANLPPLPDLENVSAEELRHKLSKLSQTRSKLQGLLSLAVQLQESYMVLKTQLDLAKLRFEKISIEQPKRWSKKRTQAEQDRLTRHQSARVLLQQLRLQQIELETDIAAIDRDLQELQAEIAKHAAGNQWLEDLAAYRAVVHRDQLQKLLTEGYLAELIEGVNEQLIALDAPFSVELGKQLTLQVVNADGSTELVVEQSGAEQAVLALAYRLALGGDLLVLDEPTAGLDRKNLGCLGNVLKNLSALTRQQGRQIVMVTHDVRLESYFDQIIQLESPVEG